MRNEYTHRQHNAICDRCGFKYKSNKLRLEWTGLRVCAGGGTNDCFEERHPQDFARGREDRQNPAWVRPEAEDVFVEVNEITPEDL